MKVGLTVAVCVWVWGVSAVSGQAPGIDAAWERVADLVYPVRAPAVATDGAKVFVFGGSTRGNVKSAYTQIFDPAAQAWTVGAEMPEAVDWSSAVYARGRFHLLGGVTNRVAATDQHWIYDPVEDVWTVGPIMPSRGAGAATVVIDGLALVVGGIDGPSAHSARLRVLDLESGQWSSLADAPAARINWQAAVVDGGLLVAGGSGPGRSTGSALYRYNVLSREWSVHAPLPAPNEGYAAAAVEGLYCVLGGRVTPRSGSFGRPYDGVHCFELTTGEWSSAPRLPRAIQELGAVAVGSALYSIGGRVSFDDVTGEVYRLRF
jgi:N-acetylneuraminic acid mutarotase